MKPPQFEYARPTSVSEALALLYKHDNAKLLAGGQSLVPMLNFRLATPDIIIDIDHISGLGEISVTAEGLRIGATVRWRELELSPLVASHNPLLVEAVGHVAHYQIRNRGTIGGSCAHADPAAEIPAMALLCDASFLIAGRAGERTVKASDFFIGALETALASDELLIAICFPPWPAGRRFAFEEFSRRRGDFALAGVAALLDFEAGDRCRNAAIVAFGIGDRAVRLSELENLLRDRIPSEEIIRAAAALAAQECDAKSDMHAPAEYRRALVDTLTQRALARATAVSCRESA